MEVSYGNPWPFRQNKCSPIYVCCLIAKLNVRQVYHLYGILYTIVHVITDLQRHPPPVAVKKPVSKPPPVAGM